MDCIFSNHSYQQWLRIKNCLSKHNYFVNVKSGLFSIFLVKQHNTPKCLKNSYIFLILEPIGRFVHCKKCSPPNMANKMSRNINLDHHLCLIFQIWLHNNASWQKGHLIVHLACIIWNPSVNSNWIYSPETLNLGRNWWYVIPCDLEIWWMTLENNKAHLLCYFKLCAAFRSHWRIQTGVIVRKRPIWVKFDDS